jgi:hypothetical protein
MPRVGLAIAVVITAAGLAACSDGDDDDATTPTAVVDEDFPGDALDATCARLEAADGTDQEAIAAALLDELIRLGDAELAINTLELAVIDRCPEWSDAVTAAIAARR